MAGLRRNAQAYEAVFGRITRRNGGRMYSDEVLGRLKAARALKKSGRAPTLERAFERVRESLRGAEDASQNPNASFEAEVMARLDALTNAVEGLTEKHVLREREEGLVARDERGEDRLGPEEDVQIVEQIRLPGQGEAADAPRVDERPAEALPEDAPPEDVRREQDETLPEEAEEERNKRVTFYISEEVWRFLSLSRLQGHGHVRAGGGARARKDARP